MARIFITGSSDGLGSLTAKRLISQGHQVILHARNPQRAADAQHLCPGSEACLVGDLASLSETKALAAAANQLGPFDCVLHNAALGRAAVAAAATPPAATFTVNTLAPYVLTCLMAKPRRLVYVSSGLHRGGRPTLLPQDLEQSGYADTKLHDVLLAKAFARRWAEEVESNAVNPGWVPTKMGGASAPGDLEKSVDCFVMMCLGEGEAKGKTGTYFQDSKMVSPAEVTDDVDVQDGLLHRLKEMSGVDYE